MSERPVNGKCGKRISDFQYCDLAPDHGWACAGTQHIPTEAKLSAALALRTEAIVDRALLWDSLRNAKESDGEPWEFTDAEKRTILDDCIIPAIRKAQFEHQHTDACYALVPETEGKGHYLTCGRVAGEKLYTQSELDAKLSAALALWTEAIAKHAPKVEDMDDDDRPQLSCLACDWQSKESETECAEEQWQAHIRSLSPDPERKALPEAFLAKYGGTCPCCQNTKKTASDKGEIDCPYCVTGERSWKLTPKAPERIAGATKELRERLEESNRNVKFLFDQNEYNRHAAVANLEYSQDLERQLAEARALGATERKAPFEIREMTQPERDNLRSYYAKRRKAPEGGK